MSVASPATDGSSVVALEPGMGDLAPVPSEAGPPLTPPATTPAQPTAPRHWFVNDTLGNPLKTHSPAEEQLALQIAQTINAKRKCNKLAQLTLDADATRAAKAHAEDMTGRGFLGLVTPEGLTTADRLKLLNATPFMSATEVVASSAADKCGAANEVVTAWLMSGPGQEKLLSATFTHLGIGVAAPAGKPAQISAVLLQRGEQ